MIETLSKVVAPYEEARKHMEEIMNSTTLAELVHLAMQLPTVGTNGENSGSCSALAEVPTADKRQFPKAPSARLSPDSAPDIKDGRVAKNKQGE